jgi:hypothetical protein
LFLRIVLGLYVVWQNQYNLSAALLHITMDSDIPEKDYNRILGVLQEENVSIPELVNVLLTEKRFKNHAVLVDLLRNAGTIVTSILGHRQLLDDARDQICAAIERIYAREIQDLVQASAGWHFT